MSDLLPILQSQAAPMALCSICAEPGACCRNLTFSTDDGLAITFWKLNWTADAMQWIYDRDLPMIPARIRSTHQTEEGDEYVLVAFDCPKLLPNGRCGIYETRPMLCRTYVPGQDSLCVMGNVAPRNP